jgi:hypothetical protein
MNAAAWLFLGIIAGVFLYDYVIWRVYGGRATISTGIREGPRWVAFVLGVITGGLATHFFLWQY